jgi:uncharacterized membrane protein
MTSQAKGSGAGSALKDAGAPLMDEARNLAGVVRERAISSIADRMGLMTKRLTEYTLNGGGSGLLSAVKGPGNGAKAGGAKGGKVGAALAAGGQMLKQAVGGGTKSQQLKVTNIVEEIDVGAPVSVCYNQWTRFTDFPTFMKKVENVEQESDEKLKWRAGILWSHRSWESTIIEQVPDERIVWRSDGDKGHVDGGVSFHELAPDLTRIVMVLEYHPKGFVERTGNLWRAQGRRARLELKHFARHVMTETVLHPDEVEGWRGEIHDGQVAGTDEEEQEQEPEEEQQEQEPDNKRGTRR